jgi:hypothetical protein
MNKTKIIIVGAKAPDNSSTVANNVLQADHNDLCLLLSSSKSTIDIICYDVAYPYVADIDCIKYVNDHFHFGDTEPLFTDGLNIIIEFCNPLDENFINHSSYGNRQYENLMQYNGRYKIAVVSCGCGWNQGFPLDCVKEIIKNNFVTPCDAYNVDSLLYIISTVQMLKNDEILSTMYPYLRGLYQCCGTLMWRGSSADEYFSENVIRDLFAIIGTDMVCLEYRIELNAFIEKEKHWNQLKWSLRNQLNEYIYAFDART